MKRWPIVVVGRLSALRAERLLDDARRAGPTGPERGQVLTGSGPVDLDLDRTVGHGAATFDRAVDFLRGFGQQRAVAEVLPREAVAALGETILIALRVGPATVVALNRIVAVVDEPRRWGFTYGTLPGHVESGEESFLVEHRVGDEVVVRIRARAAVALPASRVLEPLLVPIQRRYARRYLDAVAQAVADHADVDLDGDASGR